MTNSYLWLTETWNVGTGSGTKKDNAIWCRRVKVKHILKEMWTDPTQNELYKQSSKFNGRNVW